MFRRAKDAAAAAAKIAAQASKVAGGPDFERLMGVAPAEVTREEVILDTAVKLAVADIRCVSSSESGVVDMAQWATYNVGLAEALVAAVEAAAADDDDA